MKRLTWKKLEFTTRQSYQKDSLLIVLDLNGLNKISIYQENGKLLGSYLPTGMGADRGLYILTMTLDDKGILSAYDFGNDRLVEFDLNHFGQPEFGPKFIDMPKDKNTFVWQNQVRQLSLPECLTTVDTV